MKYKNTKTGAIIDSSCVIKGGDWITIKEGPEVTEIPDQEKPKAPETPEAPETPGAPETQNPEAASKNKEGFDGITIKEIKQELDAFGIKYNPKARKQELYDLMLKGR